MKDNKTKTESKDLKSKKSGAQKSEAFKDFFMRNNKRNLKITIGAVVAVLLILIAVVAFFITNKLGLINFTEGTTGDANATFAPEEQFEAMYDVSDASDIDTLLEKWATNGGKKYRSKNVINVLLLGVDGKTGDAKGGRSDVMMLLSLNKKTKKITLVSFLRDSYTYMVINGEGRCCKLNHTHNWGGPLTLIETLENDYKIEIDNYISVDFTSFPKLIDALGGVTVPVKDYEADYINRTTTKIKKIKAGNKVKLDGKQALVFSRIRHVDAQGDVGRTGRQRLIIMALIKSAQTATNGQLNNAMNIVLPNVATNYKKTEVLSLLTQAISQNWMDYDIKQIVMPSKGNYVGATLWTYYAKIAGSPLSTWVIDYPVCARELQIALYGDTNIQISEDHISAVDLLTKGATPNPGYKGPDKLSNVKDTVPETNKPKPSQENTDPIVPNTEKPSKEDPSHILPEFPDIGDLIPTRPHRPDKNPTETVNGHTNAAA